MEIVRLDDYQSWLLRLRDAGGRIVQIAVDPWLSPRFVVGGAWLFAREHRDALLDLDAIGPLDAAIVTAPFADHCDLATLARLPATLPIYANAAVCRRLRRRGRIGERVAAGMSREVAPGIALSFVAPAEPYRHSSLGFVVREAASGCALGFETHIVAPAELARFGPLDVLVHPVESVHLLGRRLVAGPRAAAEVAAATQARSFVPTGSDPQRSRGLLSTLLRVRGSLDELGAMLAEQGGGTQLVALAAGERFVVESTRVSTRSGHVAGSSS
jgi:L-ascorbate metabolism protein UlaG (beta-lactamase superfamily)